MPECQTVRHPNSPVPDWIKITMSEQVRYQIKLTQSGNFLVWYRTKIRHAGMPMPALVSSMPMPSYVNDPLILVSLLHCPTASLTHCQCFQWSYRPAVTDPCLPSPLSFCVTDPLPHYLNVPQILPPCPTFPPRKSNPASLPYLSTA
jgi:hypothetical protein